MKRKFGIVIVAALAVMATANAQSRRARDEVNDGPALGVARVSVADGDVRLQRPSGADFQARASTALVYGDRLKTGDDSKAEVQFDVGNFLRMSSNSEVKIEELGNKRFQFEVVRGLVSFSQFRNAEADVEITTPQTTVYPLKRGVYVVEVRDVGQTDVTVRDGAADVDTDRGTQKVKGGMISVRGQDRDVSVRMAKAEPRDSFDDWNKRRDKILEPDGGRGGWYGPSLWWGPSFGYGWGYPPGFYGGYSTIYVGGGGRAAMRADTAAAGAAGARLELGRFELSRFEFSGLELGRLEFGRLVLEQRPPDRAIRRHASGSVERP